MNLIEKVLSFPDRESEDGRSREAAKYVRRSPTNLPSRNDTFVPSIETALTWLCLCLGFTSDLEVFASSTRARPGV